MAEDTGAVQTAELTKKEQRRLKKLQKRREKHEKQRKLLFPADKKGRHVIRGMNILRVILYPIHWLVYPYKLLGNKKIGKGAYILAGNHYCIWDIFYPARTTWEGVHFLAKQSILEAPVIGYFARRFGVIGAMRDGSDVRTLMESMRVLRNGEKIVMFPEGTRNKKSDEEFLPFRGGAAVLAIKTQTPLVPFVICNRPRVFRMTYVVFGEPMDFSEYYGRKVTAEALAEAEEKLRQRLYELREAFRISRKKPCKAE